jgi:hypothetical protein
MELMSLFSGTGSLEIQGVFMRAMITMPGQRVLKINTPISLVLHW